MTTKRRPRWKDGRLDPDWLADAGLRFVRGWLRSRLEGHDSLQPIDVRADEDPEAFVVATLREIGIEHPASQAIGESAAGLLDEAIRVAPKEPAFLSRLVRLCQLVKLPHVQPWFAEYVASIVEGKSSWADSPLRRDVLYAAVTQKAGSTADWEALLERSECATLALLALAPTLRGRAAHLARWWRSVDRAEGSKELSYMLRAAVRDEDMELVTSALRNASPTMPSDLRRAIDAGLRALGVQAVLAEPAPPARARTNPISGAAQRPEYMHLAS